MGRYALFCTSALQSHPGLFHQAQADGLEVVVVTSRRRTDFEKDEWWRKLVPDSHIFHKAIPYGALGYDNSPQDLERRGITGQEFLRLLRAEPDPEAERNAKLDAYRRAYALMGIPWDDALLDPLDAYHNLKKHDVRLPFEDH